MSIERRSRLLVERATELLATDIHLVPENTKVHIYFRIDNRLYEQGNFAVPIYLKVAAHFKFLAGMDIGEQRRPQSGAFTILVQRMKVDLRVSTLPALHHESLVIRLLPQEAFIPLSHLSLFPKTKELLKQFVSKNAGLVIFTGPTGSGKTTTMYTLLRFAKENYSRKVITLEDPIEKRTAGILQVQINEKAGITYATGLKAALRHDPDMLMVGEIRDAETARVAVRAALTGHLVLTTMHTRDTTGAIHRLKDFGITKEELFQTIIGISAQRLVDIRCPFCGDNCSEYCKRDRLVRKAGVYELLYAHHLATAIREGFTIDPSFVTLEQLLNKAAALGYISAHTQRTFTGLNR